MKRTNFYVLESVSCSVKSLITGVCLLVFVGLTNHASAQLPAPTPESVLPPLKDRTECFEITKVEIEILLADLKNDPSNAEKRMLFDAYQLILDRIQGTTFDMALILAQAYPGLHSKTSDGTATNASGFYARSWNRDYTSIVNKMKK